MDWSVGIIVMVVKDNNIIGTVNFAQSRIWVIMLVLLERVLEL